MGHILHKLLQPLALVIHVAVSLPLALKISSSIKQIAEFMRRSRVEEATAAHARRQPVGVGFGLLVESTLEKKAVLAEEIPAESAMMLAAAERVELLATRGIGAYLGGGVCFPVQLADLRRLALVVQGK
jgi:pantoate kinase